MKETLSERIVRKIRITASSAAVWAPSKLIYSAALRSTEKLSLPDFLGIGAQKAASTWLWKNLRCHPELYLPATKELHYFDKHFYTSLAQYASHFAEGAGKIKGEITPAYGVLSCRTIRFISQVMPRIKVIFVMRNPIDRAWSRAKMNLRDPGKPDIDFAAYSEHEIYRALAHPSSLARGDYLTIIDNWLDYFSEDQLFIGFYDDLQRSPKQFLKAVLAFLGASTDVDWARLPVNVVPNPTPRAPIPETYLRLLEGLYAARIEALHRRFGAKVGSWRCAGTALELDPSAGSSAHSAKSGS